MSDQNFSQQDPPPQAPVGYPAQPGYSVQPGYPVQPGHPMQPGYPAPYAPLPPRPPLSPRQKSGAMLAGGVGFTMFALGSLIAFALAMFTLVAGVIAAVFAIIGATDPSGRDAFEEFLDGFGSLPIGILVTLSIVTFVVAIGLMLAGILLSTRILKTHGVNRPVAITWSGLGIGTVAYWILSSVVSIVPSLIGSIADGVVEAAVAIFTVVLALALLVAIGMFTWWWMAHAFRARDAG